MTPPGFPLPSMPVGIVAHLEDPELAVGPEVDRDRVDDQRLGGDQLDAQARLGPERRAAPPRATAAAASRRRPRLACRRWNPAGTTRCTASR